MKKWILTIAVLFAGLTALAQGTINTRSYRLSDFTDKVTQVVLTGNEVLSGALSQEVVAQWTASAFEFCTLEQFEKLKTDDRYYFLMAAESRFKGEENPGITFLTLVKGGPEASEGIGSMFEVVSFPLMAAMGGNGRELIFLGALVKAVQEFALAAMESEKVAYGAEGWINQRYDQEGRMMQIFIPEEDLSPAVKEKDLEKYLDDDFHIVDTAEEADQYYLDGTYNTLVGYTVAPVLPEKASYCYKMLFEAHSGSLYHISRHKYTPKKGVGFLPQDLRQLSHKR